MKLGDVLGWVLEPGQGNPPRPVPAAPRVIEERCTGCGLCAKECGLFVIEMRDARPFVARGTECVECGHCLAICPTGALWDPLAVPGDNRPYRLEDLPSSRSLQLLFRARRSVRKYKDRPVSRPVLEKILDAGRYAPTGGNRPDVHYIVVTSRAEIEWLRAAVLESVLKMFRMVRKAPKTASLILGREALDISNTYAPMLEDFRDRWNRTGDDRIFYHAPVLMLVHGRKWDDIVAFGNAVALYQASLMAQTLKVGCCFNGFLQAAANFDGRIKRRMGIPGRHKCYGAMGLGYEKTRFRRLVRRRPPRVTWR